MEPVKISRAMLQRLPGYLSYLKSLPGQDHNISATAIAAALGLGDVQVRKDLARISHQGRRRTGRSRDQLIWDIEQYLNLSSETTAVVVGAGAMGQALVDYVGFDNSGMNVMACFDIRPELSKTQRGKPVYPVSEMKDFCRRYNVRIGIVTVMPEQAQKACDALVACGIQGIWNFTPVQLNVPAGVVVRSENLAVSISELRMQVRGETLEDRSMAVGS